MFDAKSLLNALIVAGSNRTTPGQAPGADGGGLGGMLNTIAAQIQTSKASGGASGGGLGGGGLGGLFGTVLGQATQGLQDASTRSGLSQKATETLSQVSGGRSPEDLMSQARAMLGGNQMAAGAVLGSLGALVFGTSAGRGVAASAVKLGGLALIGGLAYKAYQNYSAGKPIIATDSSLLPAPQGSGFEADAASNETAKLFLRTMIAAAAADGHIDDSERQAITEALSKAGLDEEASAWLNHELAHPAAVDTLVEGAVTAELQAQVYTAARIAINPDTPAEKDFLAGLSGALGLDAELVANIDAAAATAKA
jgi:uncharacterized membrane protein YebE (DUF533 family)